MRKSQWFSITLDVNHLEEENERTQKEKSKRLTIVVVGETVVRNFVDSGDFETESTKNIHRTFSTHKIVLNNYTIIYIIAYINKNDEIPYHCTHTTNPFINKLFSMLYLLRLSTYNKHFLLGIRGWKSRQCNICSRYLINVFDSFSSLN